MNKLYLYIFLSALLSICEIACQSQSDNFTNNDLASAEKISGNYLDAKMLSEHRELNNIVFIFSSNTHKVCGGILTGPREILTDGHCIGREDIDHPENIMISQNGAVIYKEKKVTLAKQSKFYGQWVDDFFGDGQHGEVSSDLAELLLNEDFPFEKFEYETRVDVDDEIMYFGFCYKDRAGLPFVEPLYSSLSNIRTTDSLFMGKLPKPRVCDGDSGSPAFTLKNNKLKLAGLVSNTFPALGGEQYVFFTNLSKTNLKEIF